MNLWSSFCACQKVPVDHARSNFDRQSQTFKLNCYKNFHKNAEISRLVFDRINMK